MDKRVVGLGLAGVNYLGRLARYADADGRREFEHFTIQGGGPTATALAVLATFHTRTAFVGKVSDDDFGRFAVRSLSTLGVDVSNAIVAPGHVSPFSLVVVDAEGRLSISYTPGNVPHMGPSELREAVLDEASLLLVDGHQPRAQVALAKAARAKRIPVLLSAGTAADSTGELVALADALVCSERFAADVAPRGELEDSLAELRALGPRTVVITLGKGGSIGAQGEELVRQPEFPVALVDDTEARDVYAGAFAYGLLEEWPLGRRMHFASVAAALSCRVLGRSAGLPDLAEVLRTCGWRG
jgi:sulfofructose kinase